MVNRRKVPGQTDTLFLAVRWLISDATNESWFVFSGVLTKRKRFRDRFVRLVLNAFGVFQAWDRIERDNEYALPRVVSDLVSKTRRFELKFVRQ